MFRAYFTHQLHAHQHPSVGAAATTYPLLPCGLDSFREAHTQDEAQLLSSANAATATSLIAANSYDNFMSTYQTLVHHQQQPQQQQEPVQQSHSHQLTLSTLSGLSDRQCTSCGDIYDYELAKDLRGCRLVGKGEGGRAMQCDVLCVCSGKDCYEFFCFLSETHSNTL